MNRLIVWRHGESAWNAVGRVQGQADVELSDVGRRQAEAAAERLAALRPARIVASDLRRAAETAAVLASATGLEVTYDPRLRERYYGPWQGLTFAEIAERWPVEHARWVAGESTVGLDVETLDDLAKRAAAALADAAGVSDDGSGREGTAGGGVTGHGVAEGSVAGGGVAGGGVADHGLAAGGDVGRSIAAGADPDRDPVIVVATHGGAARQGCGALLGWPEHVIRTFGGLGNCRWTELRYHPVRGWFLRSHNSGPQD